MTFQLTFTYPDSAPVTACKDLPSTRQAVKWKSNCEAICGRNHLGTAFRTSTLTTVTKILTGKQYTTLVDLISGITMSANANKALAMLKRARSPKADDKVARLLALVEAQGGLISALEQAHKGSSDKANRRQYADLIAERAKERDKASREAGPIGNYI